MRKYIEYNSLWNQGIKNFDNGFCTVVAVATICGMSYMRAYKKMMREGRKKRRGAHPITYRTLLRKQGYLVERVDFRRDGVKTIAQAQANYVSGKYLIESRGHISAIVDGDLNDWTNPEKVEGNARKSGRHVVDVHKCTYVGTDKTYKQYKKRVIGDLLQ